MHFPLTRPVSVQSASQNLSGSLDSVIQWIIKHKTHFLAWSILYLCTIFLSPFGGFIFNIFGSIVAFAIYAPIFYSLACIILPLEKISTKISCYLLLYVVLVTLKYMMWVYIFPAMGYDNADMQEPKGIIQDYAFNYVLMTVGAYGYYASRQALNKEKKQQLLEASFHLFKFDTHLTFNILNSLYYDFFEVNPKASQTIKHFSKWLGASVLANPNQKTLLSDEINFIKRYIELQTVLKEKIHVKLDVPEKLPNISVAPRVLASLVENAIKHGITDDFQKPVTIRLVIKEYIEFSTHNWINFQTSKTSTGFGKEILTGLLETHYGNNFQLSLNEMSGQFYSQLTLPI